MWTVRQYRVRCQVRSNSKGESQQSLDSGRALAQAGEFPFQNEAITLDVRACAGLSLELCAWMFCYYQT